MQNKRQNNILIIGGPNVGKTHFGGQLYGRLQMRDSYYKIVSPPENLTVFKEVLENLYDGKSAGHTNVSANDVLELELEYSTGTNLLFSFPDYGGEQVKSIVNDRRINKLWADQIEKSDAWLLFMRLDEVSQVDDIINRGLPEQSVLKERNETKEPMVPSTSAFFVELLQMLLFAKKIAKQRKVHNPKLTIVLSCWDCIASQVEGKLPKVVLQERLPALYSYINAIWSENSCSVIGLSSTEKTLSNDVSDVDYLNLGPESFGYIITPDGKKEKDLTLSISITIGEVN